MKRKYSSPAVYAPFKQPRRNTQGTRVVVPLRSQAQVFPLSAPVRYQQRHQGGEVKSLDTVSPAANATASAVWPINTTAQISILNAVTIGSSMWNRVGRKVSMKSVYVQGFITASGNNATVSDQFARIMIVYDKQPNGALPSISDVLQDQTNGAGDQHQTTPFSGLNLNNRDRFEVIADERLYLPGYTATTGVAGNVTATADKEHVEIFRKLKGREIHFKADSSPGVIGDISTGSLVMITYGNQASGSEAWALFANVRVRYTDL